jgi:uncharacterized protein YdeI (BOF family)
MRPATIWRFALALVLAWTFTGPDAMAQSARSDKNADTYTSALDRAPAGTSFARGDGFFEDFEDGIPEDWAIFDNGIGTAQSWIAATDPVLTTFAVSQFENVDSGLTADWLVTPALTLAADAPELAFDAAESFGFADFGSAYSVLVSTTSQTDPASFTEVASYNEDDFPTAADGFANFTVDLSAYAGQSVWIAFLHTQDDGDNWLLDNVSVTTGGMTGGDQVSLPVTFEEDIDYELRGFGGAVATIVEDPTDASNTVLEVDRTAGAEFFAGVSIADVTGLAEPIPFEEGMTTMSVRVWSPEAGVPIRFKVENVDDEGVSVETETQTTVAMEFETLTFDFANEADGTAEINFDSEYTQLVIFPNFGTPEDPPLPQQVYYFDDIAFGVPGVEPLTIAEARALGDDATVTVNGTVTRSQGDFTYFQDETAGLVIRQTEGDFFDDVADGTVAPGTELTVTGTLSTFRGLLQINEGNLASYEVGEDGEVPEPEEISIQELLDNGEDYESELVEVDDLTTDATGTFEAGTNYDVTDEMATGTLRVPNAEDSEIDGTEIPEGEFTFTGVVGQFTTSDPAVDGYQLLAIAEGDVEAAAATVDFEDQTSGGITVVVSSAFLPADGYIAIHDASLLEGNVLGSVIGVSDYLEGGEYEDLAVTLFDVPGADFPADTALTMTQTLIAMPHEETSGDMEYSFLLTEGGEDGPYFVDNDPEQGAVTDDAVITIDIPGALTFEPSPLVEMLSVGETGTETVTITNTSDSDIAFDFSQYSGDGLRQMAPATSDEPSLELAKGEDDPRGYVQRFGAGGPDAFGYSWIDSNEPGGPAYEVIDISATGTEVTAADLNSDNCTFETTNVFDGGFAELDLPFDFSFYGEDYESVSVNVNGWLTFDQPDAVIDCFTNDPMPDVSAPNGGLIAPLWDDFEIGGEGPEGGQIFYETLPDGRFIVQYDNVQKFGDTTENNTFQVILSPSGTIKYQYVDLNETTFSYTIGIENPDGTVGLEVAMGADYAENGLAVLITTAPSFVTGVSPAMGTISAGGSVDVDVSFSAEGLLGGTYEGTLVVESDEPETYDLPVVLEVTGLAECAITAETIEFDDVIVGTSSSEDATVTNGGTDSCDLTGASADGAFSVEGFTAGALAPGESATFTVVYTPTESGDATGTLTVTLEGKDDLTADLSGTALDEPTPEISVESLTIEVEQGDTESGSFTISNVGGEDAADLEFNIAVAAARLSGRSGTLQNLKETADAVRSAPLGSGERSSALFAAEAEALGVYDGAPSPLRGLEILYDQVQGVSTSGLISQNNVTQPEFDNIVADDFTVPSGEAWDIEQVFARGFYGVGSGAGDCATADVTFWTDDAGVPGTEIETRSVAPAEDNGGELLMAFDAVSLSGGDYWVSVVCNGPNLDIGILGRWNWFGNTAGPFGNPSQIRNDGGEFGLAPGWNSIAGLDLDYDRDFYVAGTRGDALISVSPESGSIEPDGSEEITVTVDASDVEVGTYEFDLVIATNDPSNPTITVPVTVIVTPDVANEGDGVPTEFALGQNFPNPFASSTAIEYALPEAARVTITVYDAVGRRVAVLVDEDLTTGFHRAEWDTRGLASGVYLYRIQAGDFVKTKKMSLVR